MILVVLLPLHSQVGENFGVATEVGAVGVIGDDPAAVGDRLGDREAWNVTEHSVALAVIAEPRAAEERSIASAPLAALGPDPYDGTVLRPRVPD